MSDVVLHLNFTGLLLEGDESGWIQLLVLGVLVAMSALSGIIKSRRQRRDLEREQEPVSRPPVKPAQPREVSRAVQQRRATGPVRAPQRPGGRPIGPEDGGQEQRQEPGRARPRAIIRPGSALGAFVEEIKAEIKRAAEEMQGRVPTEQQPAPAPEPRESPEIAMPTIESALSEPPVLIERPLEPEELSLFLPELSGPDDLRRAILYYEILGSPVALRGPEDHLIGL